MSTVKAAFRGWVPAVNLDHGSTIPCGLVFQLGHKLTPSDITDGVGKLVILHHVLDIKPFVACHRVFTNQASRELVREITATISDTGVDTSNLETSLIPVLGTLFLLGMSSLCFGKFLLIFHKEFGIANDFTIGEDDKGFQSQVSTDSLFSRWQMGNVLFYQDADEVAIGTIFRDGHARGIRTIRQGARPTNIQGFAHLGKSNHPVSVGKSIRGIGGGLLIPLFMKGGIGSASFKKMNEGLIQMAKCLLKWNRRNFREPAIVFLLLEVGQPFTQVLVVETLLLVVVGIRLLTQCPIIDDATTPKGASKNRLLFWRGVHAVLICSLLFHTLYFSTHGVKSQQFRGRNGALIPSHEWRRIFSRRYDKLASQDTQTAAFIQAEQNATPTPFSG